VVSGNYRNRPSETQTTSATINAQGPYDVFELVLAGVLKGDIELIPDLPMGVIGDADPPWLGHCLEPCCDIDTIAVEVTTLHDHIAKIDPDPQDDFPLLGNALVGGSHGFLHVHCTLDGINGTGELCQDPVAHQFDDTAIAAVIGGFLVSALGGSRYQIGGPAGAFIVLVSAEQPSPPPRLQHLLDGLSASDATRGRTHEQR
jgi:hypothetical protein